MDSQKSQEKKLAEDKVFDESEDNTDLLESKTLHETCTDILQN
jgi:hypothetical protein